MRSGDVQCLSFPLTVATFFTSTSWVLYGLQLIDYYIMVRHRGHPNHTCKHSFQHGFSIPIKASILNAFSSSRLCSRFQTRLVSSPASSDFICFGDLHLSIKARRPISLCRYEDIYRPVDSTGELQWRSPITCLVSLIVQRQIYMARNELSLDDSTDEAEITSCVSHFFFCRSVSSKCLLLDHICHWRSMAFADLPTCQETCVLFTVQWIEFTSY